MRVEFRQPWGGLWVEFWKERGVEEIKESTLGRIEAGNVSAYFLAVGREAVRVTR